MAKCTMLSSALPILPCILGQCSMEMTTLVVPQHLHLSIGCWGFCTGSLLSRLNWRFSRSWRAGVRWWCTCWFTSRCGNRSIYRRLRVSARRDEQLHGLRLGLSGFLLHLLKVGLGLGDELFKRSLQFLVGKDALVHQDLVQRLAAQ